MKDLSKSLILHEKSKEIIEAICFFEKKHERLTKLSKDFDSTLITSSIKFAHQADIALRASQRLYERYKKLQTNNDI